jgi:hypothetical protein
MSRASEREAFAQQLEAAGLHDQAASWRKSAQSGALDWDGDRRQASDNFARAEVRAARASADLAVVRDVGLYRSVRRREAWERIVRHDGELVDSTGILDASPGDPDLPSAWLVRQAPETWFGYRLEPSKFLKDILQERLSIFSGYSGGRQPCEFSTSVDIIGGGGCVMNHEVFDIGPTCCTGLAAGWILDPWAEKQIVLAWRACSGCMTWARETGPMATDGPRPIHDPTGEHARKIERINVQKSKNEIAMSESKLKEAWAHHPEWTRGEDGHWHPPEHDH